MKGENKIEAILYKYNRWFSQNYFLFKDGDDTVKMFLNDNKWINEN